MGGLVISFQLLPIEQNMQHNRIKANSPIFNSGVSGRTSKDYMLSRQEESSTARSRHSATVSEFKIRLFAAKIISDSKIKDKASKGKLM